MASSTTYTTTISVPIYGSWKCEYCGEINFSTGIIQYQKGESTTSCRKSKREEAKEKANNLAKEGWKGYTLKIISNPTNNAQEMRNSLILENTCCTKCGKKPSWDKDMKYLTLFSLCMVSAIISGLFAFGLWTSIVAWLIFIASLAGFVYTFCEESRFKKTMLKMPKKYIPILGSLNEELIEYAKKEGITIPNPDETIETVKRFDETVNPSIDTKKLISQNEIVHLESTNVEQVKFCRKCGTQLQANSDFCGKCGTKIIDVEN